MIGLDFGAMDANGIGFSNIRLPNDQNSYIYQYDTRINTFPEEVFIHEFIHSLERNAKENGYTIPALHDYEKYGYQNERLIGQEKWYADYMQKKVKDQSSGAYIGLEKEVYGFKPPHQSDFEYSYPLQELREPKNIIEEIRMIFERIGNLFAKK